MKVDFSFEELSCGQDIFEEMVIYKALYQCNKFGNNQVWVRPKEMFIEHVVYDGYNVQRFKRIEE